MLEVTDDIPAAWCARQFAEWGADVVVLEPEAGSRLRRFEPLAVAKDGQEVSLLWLNVAAGKRSVKLDLANSDKVDALLRGADVLVTDREPHELARLGLDREGAHEASGGLIEVSITPFGSDGPYAGQPATELTLQALSSFMSLNGSPDRYPLKAAGYLGLYSAGVSAFVAALAALYERRRSGLGQRVEVSSFEAIASLVPLLRTEYSGVDAVRQNGPTSGTYMYDCADGHIALNPVAGRNWEDLLLALEVADEHVPGELRGEVKPPAAVRAFLERRLRELPAKRAFSALNELRIPAGLAQSPTDLLEDPHLRERAFFRPVNDPRLGRVVYPGPPFRLGEPPAQLKPAPEISAAAPYWSPRARPPSHNQTGGGSPLAGLKVLDVTQAWLGPYATMLLADLGAEVIKVESLSRPDSWRAAGTARRAPANTLSAEHWTTRPANPHAHPLNTSGSFNAFNRGKRSLNLDLTTSEGKEAFFALAARADVVMENFTPRVMSNLGLGFDSLRAVNAGLVMAAFSGYGASGPYRDYRANGATTDATSGWASLVGYPDCSPTMMGIMEADPLAGLHLASSVLVALEARAQTGRGCFIDGAMLEAGVNYIGEEILLASLTGQSPPRRGNRSRTMCPHGVFPARGEDAWIAVAVRDDVEWRILCDVLGGSLSHLRSLPAEERFGRVDEVEAAVADSTRLLDRHELGDRLRRAGVPAAPVNRASETLADTHLEARGWFQRLAHPDMGVHRYNGFPWWFSRTPARVQCRPPLQGEHSVEVLAGVLGYSAPSIRNLIERRITGSQLVASGD